MFLLALVLAQIKQNYNNLIGVVTKLYALFDFEFLGIIKFPSAVFLPICCRFKILLFQRYEQMWGNCNQL
jgi:hypothetical protein